MTDRRLPPELLDIVFNNLHPSNDDWHASWPKAKEVRKHLSACTLVSRSWYALAREHLFQDMVYSFQRPPDKGEAWTGSDIQDRWGPCPPGEQQKIHHLPLKALQMLVDFLGQSPAIRSCIRRLRLACYPTLDNNSWSSWGYNMEKQDDVDPTLLVSLLDSLPRLEVFYSWNIFISAPFVPTSTIPAASMQKAAVVYGVGQPTSLETCKLLTCFGSVNELIVVKPTYGSIDITRDSDVLSAQFPATIPLNVHSLTVSKVWNDPPLHCISALLCRSPSARNLRRLTLDTVSFLVEPAIRVMIRDLGTHLEYLKLAFHTTDDEPYMGQVMDLSAMHNLQELTIGISPRIDNPNYRVDLVETSLQYFRSTILTLKGNPRLQKITFCLSYSKYHFVGLPADDGWWDEPRLRHHITEFEAHFANLVHTFGLEGIFFECRDAASRRRRIPGGLDLLRRIGPLIFQQWARENILIMTESPHEPL